MTSHDTSLIISGGTKQGIGAIDGMAMVQFEDKSVISVYKEPHQVSNKSGAIDQFNSF